MPFNGLSSRRTPKPRFGPAAVDAGADIAKSAGAALIVILGLWLFGVQPSWHVLWAIFFFFALSKPKMKAAWKEIEARVSNDEHSGSSGDGHDAALDKSAHVQ